MPARKSPSRNLPQNFIGQKESPARKVLDWYRHNRRHLPWRGQLGETADPYHVLLSEFMLQQTVVATVIPYFKRFLVRWETLADFAKAPRSEVMGAWAGLGYYARARNLHRTAQIVMAEYGGQLPREEKVLRTLPGIGEYTAAAIRAFAFGDKAIVLDANGERIIARYAGISTPLPQAKGEIKATLAQLTPDKNAGDFAQGLMDLGQTICRARQPPLCSACPLVDNCQAYLSGDPSSLPKKLVKQRRPIRRGHVLVVVSADKRVLLLRRGDKGLLGGMHVFPTSGWADGSPKRVQYPPEKNSVLAGLNAVFTGDPQYIIQKQPVRHVFTHFAVELKVAYVGEVKRGQLKKLVGSAEGVWVPASQLDRGDGVALPTVMRKVAVAVGLLSGERHAAQ